MNLSKSMFTSIIIFSLLMTMASNNMMFSWMAMEMNLISMMPLMKKSNKMNEQSMKYLIIQSVSSSIMMMSMIMSLIINYPINESILMMTGIMTKMGMMPFHLWMPGLMQMMSWTVCMMMSTLQKIIPTIMATQMTKINLMMMPMLMSMIISPITGMKQTSIKKIMAYSSITNSPMMILSMMISKQMFFLFFIMYSMINLNLMMTFKENNTNFTNQINSQSNLMKLSMMISTLSISGMPPTTGFLMKWMMIKSLMSLTLTMTISMIISSILSTFMYLNMVLPTMTNSMKLKFKKNKNPKILMATTILINLMGIPLMMLTKIN
nr:NADH dehydrogenase subunit 2 [Penthicodes atomaria]